MLKLNELKDAAGKPLDISKVPAEVMTVLSTAFEQLGTAVGAVVTKALEPVTLKLTENETKLTELAKAPAPKPEDKPKPGEKPAGGESDAKIAALEKQLADLSASITGERTTAQLTQQAEAYLTQHLPNISPAARPLLVKAIVGAAPKDEASIKAVVEAKRAEAIAYGADKANPFGVSPKAEGGTPGNADTATAQEQATLDHLGKRLEEKRKVG